MREEEAISTMSYHRHNKQTVYGPINRELEDTRNADKSRILIRANFQQKKFHIGKSLE